MADSEKPVAKKPVSEKSDTVLSQGRIQMKPAPKKVYVDDTTIYKRLSYSGVACTCGVKGYCYIHYPPNSDRKNQKHEEIATQALETNEDDIEDSSEQQVEAVKPPAKKKKSAPKRTDKYAGITFAAENACVFKWEQINVGTTYKAMSVGMTPRSRTGLVLVPVSCTH